MEISKIKEALERMNKERMEYYSIKQLGNLGLNLTEDATAN